MKTTRRLWTRWAALFALTTILAACGAAVTPGPGADDEPGAGPGAGREPAPEPAAPRASCEDVAISVLERGAGVHGAIVSDMLHMGGATAPATCLDPANQSLLAGLSMPDERTAQVRQSQYHLIVIRYPGGNRLYVLSRRADGTSCVVDTNDECIARVTDLPDDFDLEELPDDVAPTIPAGRPAPPTVNPPPGDETPPAPSPPGGDDTPPAPSPPGGDDTPPAPIPPSGGDGAPAPGPPPGDGAPPAAAGTLPGSVSSPQPRDGATGVIRGPITTWAAAPRALGYIMYFGTSKTDLKRITADTVPPYYTKTWVPVGQAFSYETLYYWRVDALNDAGVTRGPVWSFTTVAARRRPGAPVWPAEAANFKIEYTTGGDLSCDLGEDEDCNRGRPGVFGVFTDRRDLPLPTGRAPISVQSVGAVPFALYVVTHRPIGESGAGYITANRFYGAKGTIKFLAYSSDGSAELSVPYNLTCRYTLAQIITHLSGSWVPAEHSPYSAPPYTEFTIGNNTVTTAPHATVGKVSQDLSTMWSRVGKTIPDGYHIDGHTKCNAIQNLKWEIIPQNRWWDYEGCERWIRIEFSGLVLSDGQKFAYGYVPAGCGDSP